MLRKLLSMFLFLSVFYSFAYASDTVILETNSGNITLKLYTKVAPKACENFISLAKNGYYDGVIFHRVIKDFMIQGGDPTGTGMGGTSIWEKPFEDEFSPYTLFEKKGLLAMANAGKNTNGSQFFITTVLTPWLNGHHTIFGEEIEGMDTVKKIENSAVDANNKPLKQQTIIKAHVK
ncbi:MAG: peptidylprolyl isomerase [Campylobacteraceae bacterium]|jgi:peptidylprolyl isomerase|nr:peptidylprolyl isomerase [Campylobacteraceae bacterium]